MAVEIDSEEGRVIRRLIPLHVLPSDKFAALCAKIEIKEARVGEPLFQRGEANGDFFYVLKGEINLQIESLKIETIKAGTDSARFPIAQFIPRKVSAIANGRARFLQINPDMINFNQPPAYDEKPSDMIDENLEESDDWMTTLLRSPIFRELPPANLQKIIMGLQEIRVKPGEVIIQQGEEGDYYYIIKKGKCLLSRKPTPTAKDIKLAQLSDLDTFGEDALISGEPRNVSITALTDVCLLRLDKDKFNTLIKVPSLKYVTYEEAMAYLSEGAVVIDVRGADEYSTSHLPKSISLPFFSLRMQMKILNRQLPTIVVCQNGRTSESAAFILMRYKINALILQGGLASVNPKYLETATELQNDDLGLPNYTDLKLEWPAQSLAEQAAQIQHKAGLESEIGNLEAEKNALEKRHAELSQQLATLKAELDNQ